MRVVYISVIEKNCRVRKISKKFEGPFEWVFDFGIRKISTQNFSKIVTLPKAPLKNFRGEEAKKIKIKFVKNNEEQFFKLTPIFD